MKYRLFKCYPFQVWYDAQTNKEQYQIAKRFSQIQDEGYFGDHKDLSEGLFELKWVGGRRIYYSIQKGMLILLLYGGNKNGQAQDINKARKILKEYIKTL